MSVTRTHAIVDELRDGLPDGTVVTDPDVLAGYAADAAALCSSELPMAAVLPRNEREVAQIMAASRRHRVPVVPQGALTGLSGGANTQRECLALNTRRMSGIVSIDPVNRIAVVEPGVTNKQLTDAAAEYGLTYRPDPSSWESSTIGGNIATNAGGLCCVKYGVTSRFVRGLRVVLPDGRIAALGRRTVKGVAGLNLTELFVGSEGTLGIIVQATLALEPAGADPLTMVATFPSAAAAGDAVTQARTAGITPSLFELMDHTVLRAIDDYARMGLSPDVHAVLVAQSDAGRLIGDELAALEDVCRQAGAIDVVLAEDAAESDQLVQARRLAYPALEALGAPLVDDVCVPLSSLSDVIEEVEAIAERLGLVIGVVGHAGDGNLHPTVIVDPTDPDSLQAAHRAFEQIAEFALGVGGTVTGEHGIGLLKVGLLEKELDPVAADLQRAVKELLDPDYLLNPGKVLAAGRG